MITHPKQISQTAKIIAQIILCLFLLGVAIYISVPVYAQDEPLRMARVSAPDINCIFDQDCEITVSDSSADIEFPNAEGVGVLQSRTLPQGESDTAAEGLYGYEYRIDLREMTAGSERPCILAMRMNFGPLVPIDYDQDDVLEDFYVVVEGGIGTEVPEIATQVGDLVTVDFGNGICVGDPIEGISGESTVFIGFTSRRPNRAAIAEIRTTTEEGRLTLDIRTPELQCERILSPDELSDELSGASLITFEELPNATTIGDSYRDEFGVRFEESETNNAIIYGNEPDGAASPPNTVSNSAVFPNTSEDVPLLIDFDKAQTHVGFYIGNGDGETVTGLLSAYRADGKLICEFAYPFVPNDHTTFAGIHNPDGLISRVTLDYGGTLLNESIDDLYFVAAPQPDLIIESLSLDSIVGQTLTFSYTVKNIGLASIDLAGPTAALDDNVSIRALLSQDEFFNEEEGFLVGTARLPEVVLGPGEAVSRQLETTPDADPYEYQFLTFKIDATKVAIESNEGNNTNAVAIESPNRIRVCREVNNECVGQPDALLYNVTASGSISDTMPLDENGYALDPSPLGIDESFWAMQVVSQTGPLADIGSAQFYHTSGLTPTTVLSDTFDNGNVLHLYLSAKNPLMVRDLVVSAQWTPTEDAAYQIKLTENLTKTSNFLHDFTDGQFALGNITVYQNYDEWENADVWLHADNNQRPLAVVGGMVEEITVDISPTIPLTYASGHVYMGSEWNRYYEPPGDKDIRPNVDTEDDWALALGHELSHYFLFLWDVYFGISEESTDSSEVTVEYIEECTGTAMGNLYKPENTEFIFDPSHWESACSRTFAYDQTPGRTEWDTINAWYPWTVPSSMVMSDTPSPPIDLTKINFATPTTPTVTLLNQTFDLLYEDEEDASDRARAYLIRDDRIIEQGQPAEATTAITLTGAAEGDRLCLFDIKNVVPSEELLANAGAEVVDADTSLRHQYGCKLIDVAGIEENELDLEKDTTWEPVIYIDFIESQLVNLRVEMPLTSTVANTLTLQARFYPEHESGGTQTDPFGYDPVSKSYSTTVALPDFTPSLYLQLWATDDDGDVSETNPRREAIVGSGVKGAVVPGPAIWGGGVPIISPKGDFIIIFNEAINLGVDEFIAIQETYAIPPLPTNTTPLNNISGYRLTALPNSLITDGSVSLRYLPPPSGGQINAANMDDELPDLSIYYWDGEQWNALDTAVSVGPDEYILANAPLEKGGIYALLENIIRDDTPDTYLPLIAQE